MKKAAGVAPLLVSVLLLPACGGGGSDAVEPESTDTRTTSTATPTGEASPTVEPAAGQLIKAKEVTVRAPADFEPAQSMLGFGWMAFNPGGDSIVVGEARAATRPSDDVIAEIVSGDSAWGGRPPERGEDVVVDGVQMVHLHGPNGQGRYDDSFSALVGEHLLSLHFSQKGGAAVRDRVVASVLATVDWRD